MARIYVKGYTKDDGTRVKGYYKEVGGSALAKAAKKDIKRAGNVATFYNRATGETHTIRGVKNAKQMTNLAEFVAKRKGWNYNTFASDVQMKFKKGKK